MPVNSAELTMPWRIVAVTSPPARNAPANSNTAAMTIACLIVTAPEPTDVPIAFATSFAPIPQAMNKPNRQARPMNISSCSTAVSPSVGEHQLQTAAHALRDVADLADPVDDVINEHDVNRRQFLFHIEQHAA